MSAITFNELNNQFRWRPAFSGAALRTVTKPEAASSDFKYGEPVTLSSGSVTQVATAPSAGADSSNVADTVIIYGFALADATGTTGNEVPILLAENVEVLCRVYDDSGDTASDAELQDVAVGDLAPIRRYKASSGGNIFMVVGAAASGTAAENKVVIMEKYSEYVSSSRPGEQVAGDDYGLVWVRMRDAYTTQGQ
jgi:hypothetical protein